MATVSRSNVYNVPAEQWDEWTPQAREVFNYVYSMMRANQSHFIHTDGIHNSRAHWHTTAWNAAWTAADAVTDVRKAEREMALRGARITDPH